MKIILNNFKCYRGVREFEFKEPGFYLLSGTNKINPEMGSNGIGKTSLFDAICFALYGKTSKGDRGKTLVTHGEKSASITLEVDDFIIERSISPNNLAFNGEVIDQKDLDEKLGNLTYELFLTCNYMHQGFSGFVDLTPKGKLDFLSSIIKLDIWDESSNSAKRLASISENNVNKIQQKIEITKSSIDNLNSQKSLILEELKTSVEKDINALQAEISSLEKNTIELRNTLIDLPEDAVDVKKYFESLKTSQLKLEQELKFNKKLLADLDSSKTCPVCGAPKDTDESHKNELLSKIDNISAKLLSINNELKDLEETVDIILKIEESNTIVERKIESVDLEINSKNRLIKSLESKLKVDTSSFDDLIFENEEKLLKLSNELIEHESVLPLYTFWVKSFKDIKIYALEECLNIINLYLTQFMERLGFKTIQAKFLSDRLKANDETKKEIYLQIFNSGKETTFSSLSGGEAQRLRIIINAGIADFIKSYIHSPIKFELWDEPTQWLSIEGVNFLFEFLRDRSHNKLVLLASHHNSVPDINTILI
jgi:DNA repair exonuclease SbcCD ATPase subunit